MKKLTLGILFTVCVLPASAGVIKEAQARREVDDAKQALAIMESRAELATYLPELEAYRARIFYNKSAQYLNDGDYDKASFYGVLSANYSKMSVAKGLLAKAEHDKLAALAEGRALEMVPAMLKAAGLKQKGTTGTFSGVYNLKTLYNLKKTPKVEDIPPLVEETKKNFYDIASVAVAQKDVKVTLLAKGKTEDHAAKYADSVKIALMEKGLDAARLTVNTKKGTDGVEVTLDGVKTR